MRRVKFHKGEQRIFLKKFLLETGCPSLMAINQFGFDVPYSTWKNYFSELRTLPENLFKDLCRVSKINVELLEVTYLDENYGQILGGKRNKKGKILLFL